MSYKQTLIGIFAVLALVGCNSQDSGDTATQNEPSSAPAVKPYAANDWTGKEATAFTLTSSTGETVDISQDIGKKPVVLVFYRGVW